MNKIYQRLIYPKRICTTSFIPHKLPTACFTLQYEHHFWIDDGNLRVGSKCLCGKETLQSLEDVIDDDIELE